ncbi:MAG: molybdopterin molybdotransferase MoeA [Myxococcota bacterium]|nr:molybdopterin molybdotransferase MoeA [Myxococcota bacterium]
MLAFHEARARLLADVQRLSSERVPLGEASGRVLAEDLIVQEPLPLFDHSAMDGYALATADLEEEGPWALAVLGESRAGREAPRLAHRTVCRIFTGSPLPPRADAVLMQEDATREGDTVRFDHRPKAGQHIRRAGEDLAGGSIAIRAGKRLTPGALALAAMLDRPELVIARKPRVTILCTGDELRAAGSEKRPASIPESNSVPLSAFARQAGATVRVAPIVHDDPRATTAAIERALSGADVLLTVGGVSVGDHDVVRAALERAGVALDFWRVAIKPGKPLAVGRSATAHVLGLPGNPASALVTFVIFGMPLLRAMQGDSHPNAQRLFVRLATRCKRSVGRLEFVRATLSEQAGVPVAIVHDNQASGAATSLAASDGVAIIPPGDTPLEPGAFVHFVRWSDA